MSGLRPFWRYYGGKWLAAPSYPPPRCETIIEPFAGAAGYSLRYPDHNVILVEKYPVIAEIWRWLIAASAADVLAIPCVDVVDDLPADTPLGAKFLVGFHMNAATTRPRRRISSGLLRQRVSGRDSGCGWSPTTRERVASQVERIKHWRIVEGDYTRVANMYATWFIDPPYIGRAGGYYKYGSDTLNYGQLAAWCRRRTGQVIVCEAGTAGWLPFQPHRVIKASTMNTTSGGWSHELIWTNNDR